jgi:murein DD-endopeptidase MepM/ murein hydrolase activator NlpD
MTRALLRRPIPVSATTAATAAPPRPRPGTRLRTSVAGLVAVLAALAAVLAVPPSRAAEPGPADGVWPLRPRPAVVAGFDPPASAWGSGHRGVDLAGQVGEAVRTALAGRVVFAGSLAGRGVVVVDHGATRTTYEPVDASVAVGDRVASGDVLGRLQLFGSHCFPRACLHWGLIEGRSHYLDPLTLVGAAPVRLLPLAGSAGTTSSWATPSLPARVPRPGLLPSPRLALLPAPGPFLAPAGVPAWSPLRPQARGWAWW